MKEQISDITHGEMLDMTIDASGVSSCVELAWSCLAAGGVHGQLGGFSPGTMAPIDLASGVHYQKTLKGASELDLFFLIYWKADLELLCDSYGRRISS